MMPSQDSIPFRSVLSQLRKHGLLLLSDSKLVSVTTLIVGKPIRGSWWGHRKAHDIFRVVCRIVDHPDVAVTKLISGKVTFAHRKLWPALVTVGMSREPWQMNGLSPKARNLLQIVDRKGEVRSDQLPASRKRRQAGRSEAIRELEERLLVYAEEFHSETGAHAKRLESWKHWAARVGLKPDQMATEEAKDKLQKFAQRIATGPSDIPKLPWMKR